MLWILPIRTLPMFNLDVYCRRTLNTIPPRMGSVRPRARRACRSKTTTAGFFVEGGRR